ncbi:hypothetical protein JX266_011084 [Neoarthrinium moseri]|nr:hypothetical protein JX266_011084 [Neoarthrinium moseri]
MSDFFSDFDFLASMGVDEPTFDVNWPLPTGEDFDFSAFPALGDGTLDPSLLDLPPQPMESMGEATNFPTTLLPAGGLDPGQSDYLTFPAKREEVHSSQVAEAEAARPRPVDELVNKVVTANENMPHDRMSFRCRGCAKEFHDSFDLYLHGKEARHKAWACNECSEEFDSHWVLNGHALRESHKAYACNFPGCRQAFFRDSHLQGHASHAHVPDHYQVEANHPNECVECGEICPNRAQLQGHSIEMQHSPFRCACGVKFARLDVLHRHIDSYANAMPKFPCSFCKRHRERRGFRRRDHLVQHLRGYHKFDSKEINQAVPAARERTIEWVLPVCSHSGCEHHRGESFYELSQQEQIQQRPFGKRSELTKHLKDDHGETPFPCDVPGCDKIGAKGYVREKDCMKHRVAKHPDAGPYVPAARISRIKCNIPGCGKTFKSSQSLGRHRSWDHYGYRKEIDPFV